MAETVTRLGGRPISTRERKTPSDDRLALVEFIATAADGAEMAPLVRILRDFRAVYLLPLVGFSWLMLQAHPVLLTVFFVIVVLQVFLLAVHRRRPRESA